MHGLHPADRQKNTSKDCDRRDDHNNNNNDNDDNDDDNNNNNNNDDDDDDIFGVNPEFKILIILLYQSSVEKKNSTFLLGPFYANILLGTFYAKEYLMTQKKKKRKKEQSQIKMPSSMTYVVARLQHAMSHTQLCQTTVELVCTLIWWYYKTKILCHTKMFSIVYMCCMCA